MNAVRIAPLNAGHDASLRGFLGRVSPGDRTFFREDIISEGVIDLWLAESPSSKFVAEVDGEIAGLLVIQRGPSWSQHVGEIRIVVDERFRRRGIGRSLARHAVLTGIGMGLDKLVVEVSAEDEATVAMFVQLAFEPEALLRGHVRDDRGAAHDLLVLSHFADATKAAVSVIGLAEAMGH